jgi:hypothetical protein
MDANRLQSLLVTLNKHKQNTRNKIAVSSEAEANTTILYYGYTPIRNERHVEQYSV